MISIINLWLILPTRWCLLCIRYGLYKNEKKIWQVNVVYHCGNSDQMALPSGHPQAFREKGLIQTLCFVLICADFFMIFFLSNTVVLAFLYIYTILYS